MKRPSRGIKRGSVCSGGMCEERKRPRPARGRGRERQSGILQERVAPGVLRVQSSLALRTMLSKTELPLETGP